MKKVLKKRIGYAGNFGFALMLTALFAFCAAEISAQTITPQMMKLMAERKKLDAKRGEAYEMGAQIGATGYFAEVTQKEDAKGDKNMNAQLYGDSLNARTAALAKAKTIAESINSILSSESDKLDIKQFSVYVAVTHEADALAQAYKIKKNLEAKLCQINSNLCSAFVLGYFAGTAETNAANNGEANRTTAATYLSNTGEIAKKMGIYNAANKTVVDLLQSKTPMSQVYPKVLSLRNWYKDAVAALK